MIRKVGPVGGEFPSDDGWTYLYRREDDYRYRGDMFVGVELEIRYTKRHGPTGPWFDAGRFKALPDMYLHIKIAEASNDDPVRQIGR